jgi:hypothetical protein
MTYRLVIGSDDAGFDYKEIIKQDLEHDDRVASVVDVGVDADGHTAYPHVAVDAARLVASGEAGRSWSAAPGSASRSARTRSPASGPSPRTTRSRSSAPSCPTTPRCSAWGSG